MRNRRPFAFAAGHTIPPLPRGKGLRVQFSWQGNEEGCSGGFMPPACVEDVGQLAG